MFYANLEEVLKAPQKWGISSFVDKGNYMKKSLKTLFLVMLTVLGFGQALAQDPQNFAVAGFNMGSGVTAWTAVAGDGGYGQMNFNPG